MELTVIAHAVDGFGRRLQTVTASQFGDPTPCAEWDVRTLVNHVTGELLWIPPLVEGKTIEDVGDSLDGDILGDDPHATWTQAAAAVQAVASAPGAMARTVQLSSGPTTAEDYLGQVTSDVIIHSWDLARGIGADDRWGPELAEFVTGFMAPLIDSWRAAGAFGPAVDVPSDADIQDRLLAQTGRSPSWPA